MTRPSADTVGDFWVDNQGQLWKQISYTSSPTAGFECIDGRSKGKQLDEVVGCLNMTERGLTLLRPAQPEVAA